MSAPLSACGWGYENYMYQSGRQGSCQSHYGPNPYRHAWDPFHLMGNFCVPPMKDQPAVYNSNIEGYCGYRTGYALGSQAWGNYYRTQPHQPTPP